MLKKCMCSFIAMSIIFLSTSSVFAMVDIISSVPDSVDLTIYRDIDATPEPVPLDDPEAAQKGLLMINEVRTLDLPAGESRILLRGVADAIIPQTAKLQDVNGEILESNFDYKTLTPFELLQASVGMPVTIVRGNLVTGESLEQGAIIKSTEQGVVLDVDGKLEEFHCDSKAQRIIFSAVPPQLLSEPSLSVVVRRAAAGPVKVVLSYLAVGAQWNADYVASINADGKTLDLSAWITLLNARATTFANAPVQVVAGKVEYDSTETHPPALKHERAASSCWSAISLPGKHFILGYYDSGGGEEILVTGVRTTLHELSDYKLYRIPGTTTFAAYQSKQVQMLAQKSVPFERIAHFSLDLETLQDDYSEDADDIEDGALPTTTVLRLMNDAKHNLGLPLPQGNISVMDDHHGRKIFIGQQSIKDQPVGLPVEILLGDSASVVVNPRMTKLSENKKDDTAKMNMDIHLKNYEATEVLAEIQLPILQDLSIKVLSSSHRHHIKDGKITWHIKLAPDSSKHLTFELFTREVEF